MGGMRAPQQAGPTAAAVAAAVGVSLAGVAVSLWADPGTPSLAGITSSAVVVAFTVVGAVVASARPGNRVGWMLLAGGVAWSLGSAGTDLAQRGIVDAPGSVPYVSLWAVGGSSLRAVGWFCATTGVAMLFPDGRVAGPRWRWLPRGFLLAVAASVAGAVTADDANLTDLGSWRNPVALPGSLQPLSGVLSLLGLAVGVVATGAAVAELWIRWRRGGALERRQLALFGGAAVPPVVVAPVVLAGVAGGWLFSVAALPLPFAIGVAVLARGLYDLRTAANRTLVWLTLSAAVVGLYALIIAGLGSLLDAGGAHWLPWLAAAVVAVSFAPLRDVLQRGVNRLTFGRFDEPYDVLAALGQRLEATLEPDGLLADVAAELERLGLEDVTISDEHGLVLVGLPRAHDGTLELTLWAYGREVGRLRYRMPETLAASPRPAAARRSRAPARRGAARAHAHDRPPAGARAAGAGARGGAAPAAARPARRARPGAREPRPPPGRHRAARSSATRRRARRSTGCGRSSDRRCARYGGSSKASGLRLSTSSVSPAPSRRRSSG